MSEAEKLKACPFCGGEAWLFECSGPYTDYYTIQCGDQGCCEMSDDEREPVIVRWNTRRKARGEA